MTRCRHFFVTLGSVTSYGRVTAYNHFFVTLGSATSYIYSYINRTKGYMPPIYTAKLLKSSDTAKLFGRYFCVLIILQTTPENRRKNPRTPEIGMKKPVIEALKKKFFRKVRPTILQSYKPAFRQCA